METENKYRAIRKQLNLSQDKFAAKLGVAPYTVRRWESGLFQPSPLAQKRIEELLKEAKN